MKKRIWALLLALAMLCCLFAGCGKTETPAEAPAESSAETPAEAPAEEAPAEETPAEEPAEEPAEAPEDAPAFDDSTVTGSSAVETEAVEAAVTISYPIGDGENDSVSLWYSFTSFVFGEFFNSVEEFPCMPYMQEQTGVRLEATEVSDSAATEQYQLMIASGDWCDLIPTSNYTGGAAQAYADDVILDLTDYLPDNAPDFWGFVQQHTAAEQYGGTTDGMWLTLPTISAGKTINDQGFYTRGDWLKELGLEVPTCKSEFMDMLYAMQDAYHPTHAIAQIGPSCAFEWGNSWFDVGIYAVQGNAIATYLKNGEVASGLNQDNYRDYLVWLNGLYNDGLINPEFYVSEPGRNETMSQIGGNDASYWSGMADHMYEYYSYAVDEDFEAQTLPNLLNDEGFVYMTKRAPIGGGGGGAGGGGGNAVTASCEQVEKVVQWLNWFYTEDGYMFANYGIPELCWNYDEDGKVVYTDYMLNNPDGMNSQICFTTIGWSLTNALSFGERYLDTYDQKVRDAIEMWSDTENVRYDQTIPTAAGLDADESNSVVNQITDICAYADEVILKWVIGSEPLNDDTWGAYIQRLDELGLNDVVAVYQKAYDDYAEQFGE